MEITNAKKMKISVLIFFAILTCANTGAQGWQKLFNGKDLTGWHQLNGKAPYRVEKGCIVGTCVKGEPNSFMATDKMYSDFILELEVLVDSSLNSGIQFRSNSLPEYKEGRVHGYQAEIDPSSRAFSGGVYDEARRGWLNKLDDKPEAQKAFKNGKWNKYRIEAIGNSIRIWVNGVNTTNLYDAETASGFIALQVHALYQNKPWQDGKEVRWRNIRILTSNLETNRTKGKLTTEVNLVPNFLSPAEKSNGWMLLFDGKTTNGWRGAHRTEFPKHGWKVENGTITVLKSTGGESENGGDIVTMDEYSAFELTVDFKITEGANSGIKYFVSEKEAAHPGSAFGLEFQILDDAKHPDAKLFTSTPGSRTLASLYDMIPAQNKKFNGVGEWNTARVVVKPDNTVEHWLNGIKVVEYQRGSETFRQFVAKSKYAAPAYNEQGRFGEAENGHILLQDHGDQVSFRNIKLRKL